MSLVENLEAMLFATPAPVTTRQLATALELAEGQVAQALEILEARLEEKGGLRLTKIAGGYQLCTKPEFAESVAKLLKPQTQKLTRSMLEVLAIVAYRQPITLTEMERLRGVQCDYGARALVERKLIQEVGRKSTPGSPTLYGTTQEFLHQFNLNDLAELPPLRDIGQNPNLETFQIR